MKSEIDYETITQFVFQVLATDQGTPAQSGSATVTINVQDLNDNTPIFEPDNFYHTVLTPARAALVTCAETVDATDIDDGQNAVIVYTFRNLEYTFEIGPDSGTLSSESFVSLGSPMVHHPPGCRNSH